MSDILARVTKKLLDNGAMDEIAVAVLEEALETAFTDLDTLSEKHHFEAHHWQDYAYNLSFAHACIRVLRYFTVSDYCAEESKAIYFSNLMEDRF